MRRRSKFALTVCATALLGPVGCEGTKSGAGGTPEGTSSATGSMSLVGMWHTATLLPTGEVLVAGGCTDFFWLVCGKATAAAELYDPTTGNFTATTGTMTEWRYRHTATLLPTGEVLVAGGSTAELYNPLKGTFTATGMMTTQHNGHTATLLPNGKVLVAGGNPSGTAELYDPATGSFTATGTMTARRESDTTATLLPNGKVLVAGGYVANADYSRATGTAELYDPATGTFTATGTMTAQRTYHTATLLPNGKVLVAGGYVANAPPTDTAELYDPATGTFTATGTETESRYQHTATLLVDGRVLLAGGYGSDTAELYDPATGTFTATKETMTEQRSFHTATLLPNGSVLLAGSTQCFMYGCTLSTSAELYIP